MEIIQERLEREFNLNLISTSPNVIYNIILKNGEKVRVSNPSDMPESQYIESIYEPYIKAEIITPKTYIGPLMIYVILIEVYIYQQTIYQLKKFR